MSLLLRGQKHLERLESIKVYLCSIHYIYTPLSGKLFSLYMYIYV